MDRKKILVIGSGGREHAIARKLLKSSKVSNVYFAPGNAAKEDGLEIVLLDPKNHQAVIDFIKANHVHYCIVGPEAPLADGLIDSLNKESIPCFGPTKAAAKLESSKTYAKEVMNLAGVPTAGSQYFSNEKEALDYLATREIPIVIKADGLAAGKGVTVALDMETARSAVVDCFSGNLFGSAGSRVLIEDYLDGKEASVMAIISQGHICMLPVSSDYKRALDQNLGPNTGGMGAISPTPVFSEDRLAEACKTVFKPVVDQLKKEGVDYQGFLYAGLMVSSDGSFKVLEFNCRLGDPETQSILLRIKDDFYELIEDAILDPSSLPEIVSLDDRTALTVVLSSKGYPGAVVEDNKKIIGTEIEKHSEIQIFCAGTKRVEDEVFSKGGRVLGISSLAPDSQSVRSLVYSAIDKIKFDGMQYRKDIGQF